MPMGHIPIGLVTYTSCCLIILLRSYHFAPLSPPHPFWAQAPDLMLFLLLFVNLFLLLLYKFLIPLLWASHVCFQMRPILHVVTFSINGHGFCDESDFLASTPSTWVSRIFRKRCFTQVWFTYPQWASRLFGGMGGRGVYEIKITSLGYIKPFCSFNSVSIHIDSA